MVRYDFREIDVEDLHVSITSADGIDFAEKFCDMAITKRDPRLDVSGAAYILG